MQLGWPCVPQYLTQLMLVGTVHIHLFFPQPPLFYLSLSPKLPPWPVPPQVPLLFSLSLMYLAHGPLLPVRRHGMQMSHAQGLPFDPDHRYHTIDQRRAATASSRGGYKNNTTVCFRSRRYCERSSASDDDDVRCRRVATGRRRAWPFSSFEQLWEAPVMRARRRCLCGHRHCLVATTGRNVGHVVSATWIMLQSTRRANL